MSPAVQILLTAAAIMWLASPAYVAGLYCRLKLDQRAEAKVRAEQGREVTAEWFASIADEPTPLFDQMCFERWEADL